MKKFNKIQINFANLLKKMKIKNKEQNKEFHKNKLILKRKKMKLLNQIKKFKNKKSNVKKCYKKCKIQNNVNIFYNKLLKNIQINIKILERCQVDIKIYKVQYKYSKPIE